MSEEIGVRGVRVVNGVLFNEQSLSSKLGPVVYEPYLHPKTGRLFQRPHAVAPFVSATFASIAATCPTDCPMRGAGCYAQDGFLAPSLRILDREAVGRGGLEVVQAEVEAIKAAFRPYRLAGQAHARDGRVPQDGARGGRDLRLHVSGDVPTEGAPQAARMLARAARGWKIRGGGSVFTYTHQWHRTFRSDWGGISVLASCDQPYEVAMARLRGFPSALVVAEHQSERAYSVPGVPGKVVPCPAQTRETTCAECRLCLDRDLLKLDVTVAFAAHGSRSSKHAVRARSWKLPVVA